MKRFSQVFSCVLVTAGQCHSFLLHLPRIPVLVPKQHKTELLSNPVQTLSVATWNDNDHELEGTRMASSIVMWLNAEWMPQPVHSQIAECAKTSYVSARNSGDSDVSSIMLRIAEDLESQWSQYEQQGAFANAWDIANYAADYFAYRLGTERCNCSAKIFDPDTL